MSIPPFMGSPSLLASTSSLLAAPTPEEQTAEFERDAQLERARMLVLEIWLEGYREGRLKFEDMCRRSADACAGIDAAHRQRLLGKLVEDALASIPAVVKQARKGEPLMLREMVYDLIKLVLRREELPVGASRDDNAFDRTIEILEGAGVKGLRARQIKGWYYGEK